MAETVRVFTTLRHGIWVDVTRFCAAMTRIRKQDALLCLAWNAGMSADDFWRAAICPNLV